MNSQVYQEGQRNTAKVLVVFNHSQSGTSGDACARNEEVPSYVKTVLI